MFSTHYREPKWKWSSPGTHLRCFALSELLYTALAPVVMMIGIRQLACWIIVFLWMDKKRLQDKRCRRQYSRWSWSPPPPWREGRWSQCSRSSPRSTPRCERKIIIPSLITDCVILDLSLVFKDGYSHDSQAVWNQSYTRWIDFKLKPEHHEEEGEDAEPFLAPLWRQE